MKISEKAKHAIFIGTLCSVAYLAVYIARNVLGAVTPQMVRDGFTKSYIGNISSIYFICYAFGQLINGLIGDKIKAKYMISFGLLLAGVSNFLFPKLANYPNVGLIAYASTGFFLSMIYAPLTKVAAENTEPVHATRCTLGYTFASFIGSPSAGLFATLFAWNTVFHISSFFLVFMAVVCFVFFLYFERKGIVKYNQYKKVSKGIGSYKILFKREIVKYSFISILTGIVRTSVVFWLPTYFNERLGFSEKLSSSMFSVSTLIIATTAFIVVFIYELLKRNANKTLILMFSLATVFFGMVYLFDGPVLNVGLIVLAIMASGGASTMLWSRYCPSLRDTGVVSGATGFLD
ncbi:MAG: MFS transporter, partial [Clostridia bacterium]|nr:MFS transporter [Clostridia bacterium]